MIGWTMTGFNIRTLTLYITKDLFFSSIFPLSITGRIPFPLAFSRISPAHRIRFRGGRTALALMASLICGITTSLDRPASIRSFVILARRRVPSIGNLSTLSRRATGCISSFPIICGGASALFRFAADQIYLFLVFEF